MLPSNDMYLGIVLDQTWISSVRARITVADNDFQMCIVTHTTNLIYILLVIASSPQWLVIVQSTMDRTHATSDVVLEVWVSSHSSSVCWTHVTSNYLENRNGFFGFVKSRMSVRADVLSCWRLFVSTPGAKPLTCVQFRLSACHLFIRPV